MHGAPEAFHGANETAATRMLRGDDAGVDPLYVSHRLRKPAGWSLMPDIAELLAAPHEEARAMLLAQAA